MHLYDRNYTICSYYAVWKELEKENKEFFEEYKESQNNKDRMTEEETSAMIQKMILDSKEQGSSKESNKQE